MLYKNCRGEFTYGAKIVMRGLKMQDTINTERGTEKTRQKREVLINKKPQHPEGLR